VSPQGILLIDLFALLLIAGIVNLVRVKKLYAGYAVIWISALALMGVTISIPKLLDSVTHAVGAIFPASAMSLLAFVFMFLVLVFFSVKLSVLSERQATLIQTIALLEAGSGREDEDDRSSL